MFSRLILLTAVVTLNYDIFHFIFNVNCIEHFFYAETDKLLIMIPIIGQIKMV